MSENLWANKKVRIGIMVGCGLAVLYFISSGLSSDKTPTERREGQQTPSSILGVNNAASNIQTQEIDDIVSELQQQYYQKEQDLTLREKAQKTELDEIKKQLQDQQSITFEMNNMMKAMVQGGSNNSSRNARNLANTKQPQNPQQRQGYVDGESQPVNFVNNQPGLVRRPQTEIVTGAPQTYDDNVIRTITQRKVREVKRSGMVEERDIMDTSLSANSQTVNRPDDKPMKSKGGKADKKSNEGLYTLTMGSIISGTALNGVAAPTGVNSANEPIPVLMRIKKEAIMPNHFTLDIRECHMIGAAKGNLSDERVYIRAEAISCITEDGQAIEQNITAYAVSSTDGMAGIRGEVVFRSNDMIANSMFAGFIAGFSDAATPQQVQSINTNPQASSIWEASRLDTYAGAGILSGASSAANKIADYYLQMAESTWPVVELLPGVQIDFIVQKGMTMQLDGDKAMRTE
jgi:conjugal transfer pilus assembly protein TraB